MKTRTKWGIALRAAICIVCVALLLAYSHISVFNAGYDRGGMDAARYFMQKKGTVY